MSARRGRQPPPNAVDDARHQRADRQLRTDVPRSRGVRSTRNSREFDLLVLDEAQRIKNRESRTAQVARSIPRRRSWALTGTPIENRPEELVVALRIFGGRPAAGRPRSQATAAALEDVHPAAHQGPGDDGSAAASRSRRVPRADPAQQHAYKIAEKEGVIHLDELGESISVQHVFELVLRLKQITNFDPLTGESVKARAARWPKWKKSPKATAKPSCSANGPRRSTGSTSGCMPFGPLIYHGGVPTRETRADPQAVQRGSRLPPPLDELRHRRRRAQFAVCRLCVPVRPLVEPGRRGPGNQPGPSHRPEKPGHRHAVHLAKTRSKSGSTLVLRQKRELVRLGAGRRQATTNASLSMSASEIFGLFDLKARDARGVKSVSPPEPTSGETTAAA